MTISKVPTQVPLIRSVEPGAAWLIFFCRLACAQLTWIGAALAGAAHRSASNAIPMTVAARIGRRILSRRRLSCKPGGKARQSAPMRPGILIALLACVICAAAAATADAKYFFGSKLDSTVQPSNANSPHPCLQPARLCTWVMNEAYGRPNGGHKAKKRGTIKKIRLIAGAPGRFRVQIVRARQTATGFEAKAVRNGPRIRYHGQPDDFEPYVVESFRVSIPIRKGERLAIRTRKTSTLRCSSGGPNTLLFDPPLVVGHGYKKMKDEEGCWLLLEAVVKTG